MRRAADQLRNHPVRTALVAIAAAAAIVVLGAGYSLLSLRGDLERGRDRLDGLDLDALRAQGLAGALDAAAGDLDAAARHARSPFLDVLAPLPVVGDQVDAVRDLTGAAASLGHEARTTGRRIGRALDRAGARPAARIELLDVVLAELDRVEAVAAGIDLGDTDGLLPPLRTARADVRRSLDDLPARLDPLADQVTALRKLLAGPTSYLVVVGNNAEMRAGAGMPLSAGLARLTRGDIELGDFRPTVRDLYADGADGFEPDVPAALRRTYPRWNLGRDFPETAVIPHFPVTAPMYAAIASNEQGWDPAGVIQIDVLALARLLEVVGPIDVAGVRFTAGSTPELLLNRMYVAFEGRDHQQRRDSLGKVAQAIFDAMQARDVDLLDVVAALQDAADGRHLMAWSRDPTVQGVFEDLGASGAISPFETLVSVQNTGANKLDWYIRPAVAVTAEPDVSRREWIVTMTITVSHPDRELTATYIEGPLPSLAGGKHRALVTAQLPVVATSASMPGAKVTELGFDGISQVIGTRVVIPRGSDRRIVVRFRLPQEHPGLAVAPSARAFPVPWTFRGVPYDDDESFLVSFGPLPRPADRSLLLGSWLGVSIALAGLAFMATSARDAGASRGAEHLRRVDSLLGAGLFVLAFVAIAVGVAL